MRKLNSFILIPLLGTVIFSGCGMPGPLYQTPEKEQQQSDKKDSKDNKQQESL